MSKRSGERRPEEAQIEKALGPNEIATGIEKLNRRIVQVNCLLQERVRWNAQKRKDVEFAIHKTILDIFGELSSENKRYGHHRIWKGSLNMGDPESVMQRKFEEGIPETVTMLESLIENLKEKQHDIESQFSRQKDKVSVSSESSLDKKAIFVIHGRNENLRKSMFNFLRSIGLQPIEWSQAIKLTGKASPFIGEVLDVAFGSAQAIVALLSPDDEARLLPQYQNAGDESHEKKLTPQARPNVLFETGMAFGKNPNRTVIVQVGRLRPFSDIQGRHVLKFDGSPELRLELCNRLECCCSHWVAAL